MAQSLSVPGLPPVVLEGSGALLSPDRLFRYALWRTWDPALPRLHYCLLNPSTADEIKPDPTVTRQCRRAELLGYGGLVITNLFAFRATDPPDMKSAPDPVGPCNDSTLALVADMSPVTICGWGTDGGFRNRDRAVMALLDGLPLHCLEVTNGGFPNHPLYQPYRLRPQPYHGRP